MPPFYLNSSMETENSGFPEIMIGNQGLRKKILEKGISWQTPFPGDEVEVHFSGHVEGGASLDSSRQEGVPFKFKLGQGEVIKGWDEGVATMKKGERAIFTIPSNLGYGEAAGSPSATLVFEIEMLSWISIRDLTGDGGILKKIMKEAEGWATPRDGDEVCVKYEVRLEEDGMLVSISDEGVEFHIGDGYLCPALSTAVKTMRRDGLSQNEILVPGVDDNIPAYSNLTIQVELVSWRSVTDITGDKKVLKKSTKAGEGLDHPNEGSQVKVTYIGKLADGRVFDRKGTNEEPFEFVSLEGQVNEGLDRAILTMKKGEHAIVVVDAEYLCPHYVSGMLPANSLHHYEVELIDFTKEKPFWKMDTQEKLEACERKKLDGNVLFMAGKFWRASNKYDKVAK